MTPCLGEIRAFGGNFAPVGWNMCDGSLLQISEYNALYALIGTTYGGDGNTTFAVPDLRGRSLLSQGRAPSGTTYVLAQKAGTETITLTTAQMPAHTHSVLATSGNATAQSPANAFLAKTVNVPTPAASANLYIAPTATGVVQSPLANNSITSAGGSQPHDNRMPVIAISYIIALVGVYPSLT